MFRSAIVVAASLLALLVGGTNRSLADDSAGFDFGKLPTNTWVKLSPLDRAPPSPRLGYEGACVWDSKHQRVIRYGGHNQGGGGEQNSELWSFDPRTAVWKLHEPNLQPVGICCGQQNIFDPVSGRYIRFPAFSASHGWQWLREVWLNDSSVWTYDLDANLWRNMRPLPTAHPRPLRCASYDREHQVLVLFGGEGSSEGTWVYDPQQNAWTKMDPKPEPAPRSGGNMAYDQVNKVHVLFGTQFDNDQHTWVYDLRKNEWRDMEPKEMPPTDKNDAVLTYFEPTGEILAIIKQTEGKDDDAQHSLQTWAYSVGLNRWRKINPEREPDPTSNRARQLMFAPELGVALLENRPSNSKGPAEQQIWALKLPPGDATSAPLPPQNVRIVSLGEAGAMLSWEAPPGKVQQYAVQYAKGETPWKLTFSEIVRTKGTGYGWPKSKGLSGIHHYRVTAIDEQGRESRPSVRVTWRPPVVEDVTVSVLGVERVKVSWKASSSSKEVRYLLERAAVEVLSDDQLKRLKAQTPPLESPSVGRIVSVGPFQKIVDQPLAETSFVDTTVNLARPQAPPEMPIEQRKVTDEDLDKEGRAYRFAVYAYRVRAVDPPGVLSGPSPATLTIPSPPQQLFSREEGMTCHLRWQASPEEGLQGYRVYRMDGRYAKDAIPRLTADPIKDLAFNDPAAGKNTRRYYVVAVDALGQEGFPTSPVWFDREWKPFYKPFTGEWHQ